MEFPFSDEGLENFVAYNNSDCQRTYGEKCARNAEKSIARIQKFA